MTRTGKAASLLHVAVRDLHAGKRLQAERLVPLAVAAGHALAALIRGEAVRAGAHAERPAGTGFAIAGPANLWMAEILDDADRDARSHRLGRLRDVALIGALRKAKAAEIVSSETAIALAEAIGDPAMRAAAAADREEEIATDRALKALLLSSVGHGDATPG